jgi:hypothetical protein
MITLAKDGTWPPAAGHGLHRRQAAHALFTRPRSVTATATAATPHIRTVPAAATTPRWQSSSWSERPVPPGHHALLGPDPLLPRWTPLHRGFLMDRPASPHPSPMGAAASAAEAPTDAGIRPVLPGPAPTAPNETAPVATHGTAAADSPRAADGEGKRRLPWAWGTGDPAHRHLPAARRQRLLRLATPTPPPQRPGDPGGGPGPARSAPARHGRCRRPHASSGGARGRPGGAFRCGWADSGPALGASPEWPPARQH